MNARTRRAVIRASLLLSAAFASRAAAAGEENWPQFRGPGGLGIAAGKAKLPLQFNTIKNVQWKTPLPAGLSSPCVWGDRIFLTGFDGKAKLETLGLDRRTGKVLWRKTAPAKRIERVQAASSPASATPAADAERVYSYFGSYGLLCYDHDGKELWKLPLPVPKTRFGSGTSPVVADGVVLLKCQGVPKKLLALNPRTGDILWKKDPLPLDPAYSLPMVRAHKGGKEVVLHGETGVRAYDLKDGKERWSLANMFCAGIPTPIASDGLLFFVVQFPGGDRDDPLKIPSFDEMLKKYDKNKDGKLDRDEVKDVILYSRDAENKAGDIRLIDLFGGLDRNKDGKLDKGEWASLNFFTMFLRNSVLAVRLDENDGKIKPTIVWKEVNALPEVASPLCYRGRLYLAKHGGIFTCLEAKTGKLLYRKRLGPSGLYFASPVAGDGKIYLPTPRGVVLVLDPADTFKVLARNDLEEPIAATPAIVDGVIYVRTEKHLFAFKE
jgi:outer membrane protein assembly factor BamB